MDGRAPDFTIDDFRVILLLFLVAAWCYCCFKLPHGLPPQVQSIQLSASGIGDCPAPVGYREQYFISRDVAKWRGNVLRKLPWEFPVENYAEGRICQYSIPSVEVKSKTKGIITVEMGWMGMESLEGSWKFYAPTRIVVE